MPNFTNLNLSQLRLATKADIIRSIAEYLAANFSKRNLIIWLLDADKLSDEPIRKYRPDNQIESQVEVERDAETGAILGGRKITWTYYPTGEVDTITISQRDAANVEISRKVIKHAAPVPIEQAEVI